MIDYNNVKTILNGEVECSAEEYDEAVKDANTMIDLLIEIASLANEIGESTFKIEKIRKKVNKEIKGSKENWIYEW